MSPKWGVYDKIGVPSTMGWSSNFIMDTSYRAYFKDNLILIKDWIGTITTKLFVSNLQEGGITNIDFTPPPPSHTPCKEKTNNFRAIDLIQSLIYIIFSLRLAPKRGLYDKIDDFIQWGG